MGHEQLIQYEALILSHLSLFPLLGLQCLVRERQHVMGGWGDGRAGSTLFLPLLLLLHNCWVHLWECVTCLLQLIHLCPWCSFALMLTCSFCDPARLLQVAGVWEAAHSRLPGHFQAMMYWRRVSPCICGNFFWLVVEAGCSVKGLTKLLCAWLWWGCGSGGDRIRLSNGEDTSCDCPFARDTLTGGKEVGPCMGSSCMGQGPGARPSGCMAALLAMLLAACLLGYPRTCEQVIKSLQVWLKLRVTNPIQNLPVPVRMIQQQSRRRAWHAGTTHLPVSWAGDMPHTVRPCGMHGIS